MISVVTNAVVALMIVTTGFEKVVGSMEMEFVPSPCQSSNSYGLVVGSYRPKEPYVDLYRMVCTTNFVFQRGYEAGAEAKRYLESLYATNRVERLERFLGTWNNMVYDPNVNDWVYEAEDDIFAPPEPETLEYPPKFMREQRKMMEELRRKMK